MKRLRFATARQVFEAYDAAASDIEAAPDDSEPVAFIETLLRGTTPEAAVSFSAYLLPRREAVWWACQTIRATGQALTPTERELLELAETWVREPEEENRRQALKTAMASSMKNAAALAALAAGWSGGSMVDDPERPVQPPNYLTAQAVRASVLTSLALVGVKERAKHLTAAVQSAIKLAYAGGEG